MNKKDKNLERLLKAAETDRPNADFTNDIMHMISDHAISKSLSSSIDIHQSVDKAPMHMTDLVIDSITNPDKKTNPLINISEMKHAAIVISIGLLFSLAMWFTSNIEFNIKMEASTDQLVFNTVLVLISGTALWIVDQWIRNKYLNTK